MLTYNCVKFIMNKKLNPLTVAIVGLQNAGKTTLLHQLTGKKRFEILPTIGLNAEVVNYRGYKFQAIDMGGQKVFRETLWSHYTTLANGIIFVFDISDPILTNEAKYWFDRVVQWTSSKATLLFLSNKMDLKEESKKYLSLEKAINLFGLSDLSERPDISFQIFEVSALTGENVSAAMNWFFNKITDQIRQQTKISFVYLLNQENSVLYSNLVERERRDKLLEILSAKITQLREMKTSEMVLEVGEYRIVIKLEKTYSIIVGTKHLASPLNLKIAARSIAELVNKNYYPPQKYTEDLDGIINMTLIKKL